MGSKSNNYLIYNKSRIKEKNKIYPLNRDIITNKCFNSVVFNRKIKPNNHHKKILNYIILTLETYTLFSLSSPVIS
jgi:hypothetical protein